MSRIGKHPVPIPSGVEVKLGEQALTVKGKLGVQTVPLGTDIGATIEGGKVTLKPHHLTKRSKAMWGTSWALLHNAVKGVSSGFTSNLEINGVGYRAQVAGRTLTLQLGYSHDVKYELPQGIDVKVGEKQTTIQVSGADRRQVGQVAAEIRSFRPPEPYKGKGIKYVEETILRKEGKKK